MTGASTLSIVVQCFSSLKCSCSSLFSASIWGSPSASASAWSRSAFSRSFSPRRFVSSAKEEKKPPTGRVTVVKPLWMGATTVTVTSRARLIGPPEFCRKSSVTTATDRATKASNNTRPRPTRRYISVKTSVQQAPQNGGRPRRVAARAVLRASSQPEPGAVGGEWSHSSHLPPLGTEKARVLVAARGDQPSLERLELLEALARAARHGPQRVLS